MIGPIPRLLLAIVMTLIAVDAIWLSAAHFSIDWAAHLRIGAISAAFATGGVFYATLRKDERLSAMLLGTAFLISFSDLASITNYFLLTVAGTRIDAFLAGLDRALGIDWPAMIAWASRHRQFNLLLLAVYGTVLPQMALLTILLGWRSASTRIYSLCLAIVCATFLAVGFWAIFPSFGAISVYRLSPEILARTPLALDPAYAKDLLQLLANGPGLISPSDLKGLIGFPSFHAVLALLVTWYARSLPRYVFVPFIGLNLLVLISTPIQGGHHVVDVLAGFPVAAISILFAEKLTALAARRRIATFSGALSGANTTA